MKFIMIYIASNLVLGALYGIEVPSSGSAVLALPLAIFIWVLLPDGAERPLEPPRNFNNKIKVVKGKWPDDDDLSDYVNKMWPQMTWFPESNCSFCKRRGIWSVATSRTGSLYYCPKCKKAKEDF